MKCVCVNFRGFDIGVEFGKGYVLYSDFFVSIQKYPFENFF